MFENEIFEVFAYTRDSFEEWARSGVAKHRPVIVHMLVEGVTIRGETAAAELREVWRSVIATGPMPSTPELDMRRYKITDLCDDLRDVSDPVERYVIASSLFEEVADLMLLSNQRWIGSGKYLSRRLRELGIDRANALTVPLLQGDFSAFLTAAEHELDIAGGRLHAGFVR